jgi:hypothetical protein
VSPFGFSLEPTVLEFTSKLNWLVLLRCVVDHKNTHLRGIFVFTCKLGDKPSQRRRRMSAFRGKADMTFCGKSAFAVAFGGKADMAYCTAYVR